MGNQVARALICRERVAGLLHRPIRTLGHQYTGWHTFSRGQLDPALVLALAVLLHHVVEDGLRKGLVLVDVSHLVKFVIGISSVEQIVLFEGLSTVWVCVLVAC